MKIKSMAGGVLVTALFGLGMAAVPAAAEDHEPEFTHIEERPEPVGWEVAHLDCTDEPGGMTEPGITIMEDEDFLYSIKEVGDLGSVEEAGFYALEPGDYTVTGDQKPGFEFPFSLSEGVTIEDNTEDDCLVEVTPTDPTHTNKTCVEAATITIPEDEGVLWSLNSEVVEPGTSQVAPGTNYVIASPAEGYWFGEDDGGEIENRQWTIAVFGPEDPCPGDPGPAGEDGKDGEPGEDGEDGKSVIETDDVEQTASKDTLPKTGASPLVMAGIALTLMLIGIGLVGGHKARANKR